VEEVVHLSEEKERVANYRPVFVTEITDILHFFAQDVETGILRLSFVPLLFMWVAIGEGRKINVLILEFRKLARHGNPRATYADKYRIRQRIHGYIKCDVGNNSSNLLHKHCTFLHTAVVTSPSYAALH